MKNILLPFVLFSAFLFGQEKSLKETAGLFPLYVVNGMVANEPQIKAIGSPGIAAISVYKSDNLPEKLIPFINFTSEGIIDITLKENTEIQPAVSLERLNIEHQLNEMNPVYINRIFVQNNTVKILQDAIIQTEIIENKGQKLLNIWTVIKQERAGIVIRTGGIKNIPKNKNTIKNATLK